MSIKIRSVSSVDRARWEQLMNDYAIFYKTKIPGGGHDQVWSWIFDDENDFWCDLIEQDNGTIIGFTQYQLMHRSLSGKMVCYLSDLYVEQECRGIGAGRAKVDHVIVFQRLRA